MVGIGGVSVHVHAADTGTDRAIRQLRLASRGNRPGPTVLKVSTRPPPATRGWLVDWLMPRRIHPFIRLSLRPADRDMAAFSALVGDRDGFDRSGALAPVRPRPGALLMRRRLHLERYPRRFRRPGRPHPRPPAPSRRGNRTPGDDLCASRSPLRAAILFSFNYFCNLDGLACSRWWRCIRWGVATFWPQFVLGLRSTGERCSDGQP